MTSVDDVRDDLYTLHLEFFATGEGVSVWAMVTVAPSEAAAREHFWFVCFGGDERLRDHYEPGLEVIHGFDRTRLCGHTDEFLSRLEATARAAPAFTYQTHRHFNLS